ncbi:MAG: Yip1 family protein [Pseudomonadota bacterium]|jgi:hypothetical protein
MASTTTTTSTSSSKQKLVDLSAVFNRCKLVLLSPKECWQTISQEAHTPQALLRSTLIPLLLAGILCATIGMQLFGMNMGPLGTWRPAFFQYLVAQIASGVLGIAMLFIGAWLMQKLAQFFQGSVSFDRAFSLLGHASLPMLVAGLLTIYPLLGALGIVCTVIGLYALYHGSIAMTSVARNKALGFLAAFLVSMLLTSIVVYGLASLVITFPQPPLPALG